MYHFSYNVIDGIIILPETLPPRHYLERQNQGKDATFINSLLPVPEKWSDIASADWIWLHNNVGVSTYRPRIKNLGYDRENRPLTAEHLRWIVVLKAQHSSATLDGTM